VNLQIFTDGGARGNPGPAGVGVVVKQEKKTIFQASKFIGRATNNVAEYQAMILAFDWLLENKDKLSVRRVDFYFDSELLTNQMTGRYRVKAPHLKEIYLQAKRKESLLDCPVFYNSLSREKNSEADGLANQAMDAALKK
jgi:ribonuclease HI